MDETIIAKTRTDEIVEFLEKVVCERCGMNLIIQTAFRKPQESKYRKNSEKQIAQEVQSIIADVYKRQVFIPDKKRIISKRLYFQIIIEINQSCNFFLRPAI